MANIDPKTALTQIQPIITTELSSLQASVTQLTALVQALSSQVGSSASQIQSLVSSGLAYVAPPPPTPPIDVFTWFVPKTGKFVRPVIVRLLPDGRQAAYFIKTSSGWPMDIKVADNVGVYFRATENDDVSGIGWPGPNGTPNAFRLYTSQNAGTTQLGFKIAPRYYDPSQGRILVNSDPAVQGERHTDCSTFTPGKLGPGQSYISLSPQMNLGGVLGIQDVLVCEYFYTVATKTPLTFQTRERFFLTQESGWVGWDVSSRQADGSYSVTKTTMHTSSVPDTTQLPVFPCNIAL